MVQGNGTIKKALKTPKFTFKFEKKCGKGYFCIVLVTNSMILLFSSKINALISIKKCCFIDEPLKN